MTSQSPEPKSSIAPAGPPPDGAVGETSGRAFHVFITTKTLWQAVGVILVTLTALWAVNEARSLVTMLLISMFFALALVPGVNALHKRFGWRRGAAVGVIYLGGMVALILLVVFLIPAIAGLAKAIGQQGAQWLSDMNGWLSDTFGITLVSGSDAGEISDELAKALASWADNIFGTLVGVATSGLSLIFNLATIAMFTFYFAADFPRIEKAFLSWFSPDTQQRLGWTIDEAVRQTGGYFYSRLLLMLINGLGFFATMVAVGMPVALAIPLSLFGSFVSVFIPAVGTYIGGAVPILITLPVQGLTAALIVLGYVLVYQQIENYWLSPRLSAKTMTLNGGLAFGAALAGGALFGPMGAFVALPVTALIYSFISNYRRTHDVVYHSVYDIDDESQATTES